MKLVTARVAVVVVVVVMGCGHPAGAQAISGTVFSNGSIPTVSEDFIVLGPLLFRPGALLAVESRDNLYLQPGPDTTSDLAYAVGGRLAFELPLSGASKVVLDYTPRWRQLKDNKISNNLSHRLKLETDLESPIGFDLKGSYQYSSGSLDTREADPGGELGYTASSFSNQSVGVSGTYWLSPVDGIGAGGSFLDVNYDGDNFFSYQDSSVWGSWNRQLTPTLGSDLRYTRSQRDAAPVPGSSVSRDGVSNDITFGLRGAISPVLTSDLRVGWRESSYTGAASGDKPTYSGIVFEGGVTWIWTEDMTVRLAGRRSDLPSAYGGNPFLTATGADLQWRLSRVRYSTDLMLRYQQNSYEGDSSGSVGKRTDEVASVVLGVDVPLGQRLAARGSFLHEKRESNPTAGLGYTANVFTLSLVAGY